MYHNLNKIRVENFWVKKLCQSFNGYGRPQSLNTQKFFNIKNQTQKSVMCAYGHVHVQRILEQPAVSNLFC